MDKLEEIAEQIRQTFERQNARRDRALAQARQLTRACALAIRAAHRDETETMQGYLDEARTLADSLRADLLEFPDLYYDGYTQDALKEFAEASITCALLFHHPLPTPAALHIPPATYLNGLAESVGEMRRRCLDMLRRDNLTEAERLLAHMDDIYAVLVTMDYPDAITLGLRRQTDIVRSLVERTRGDLTFSLRGKELSRALARLSAQLPESPVNEFPAPLPPEAD
jgi:translin